MNKTKITEKEIKEYIFPQFETLQALLSKLHLKESLCALMFLRKLVEIEVSQINRN